MSLTKPDEVVIPPRLARWTGFLLSRVHLRAHAGFQDALAPLKLTPKSFGALTMIHEDGPLSQAALGEKLVIDRTTIVAVVDELERAGYVERGRNTADRRVHSLQATTAGKNALRAAERVAQRAQDDLLADLDTGERDQLATLLGRIADA
jgi:MarR family transcriptional regulator, lower aerobic nicotinate degradation pathway regulator